jgi:hypothetical protein
MALYREEKHMSNIGIDYSMGLGNYDKDNGIHYGVISQNEVLQAWADESEGYYGEPELDENGEEMEMDDMCEALSFTLDDGEYLAEQSSDDPDIFITKSPYYTTCQFCSPCAPGAGYIMNTIEGGIKTYCFGHDWFESGKAPYPVYSVKTNKLIDSPKDSTE